jgi:polar amino acid transport system substrate-binding protein
VTGTETTARAAGGTRIPGVLRLACIDSAAAPLFDKSTDGRRRTGYEPAAAQLVAGHLGLDLEWAIMDWDEMLPAVRSGEADAVWCGQGIIPSRAAQVDFTRPYAVFDETVLVRTGDPARAPEDLAGYRVAAIAGSANMRLAESFPGVRTVPFEGTEDVFGDMIEALRTGAVDAMVDDDVVTVPLGGGPDFDVAFTAPTENPWGVGVSPANQRLLTALDSALAAVIAGGRLAEAWQAHIPALPFPAVALAGGRPTIGGRPA